MLKEYFTDGLIQIAIIISLLRVNINPRDLIDHHPDIEELLQGPTSAYTQTRFHHHNWNRDIGAFIHPKHVDNEINDVLQDLHALGRYRNDRALNTIIDAYLVNDPEPPNLAQEAVISNDASDNNNNEQSRNNGTATTAQGTGTGTGEDVQIKKEPEEPEPIGADPTKEEALEKEKLNQQQQQELQTNITYIVDGETGELIPAPADHEVPQVQAPLQPQIQQQQVPQLQQQVQQPQQVLPQVQPQQLQQQQQQAEFDLNDDLNEAFELFRQQQQQMPIVRQNSLEQRWDDVANLLDLPEPQDIDMAPANHHPALLQNATLPAPQANGTDFNLNPQPITVEPNDTSYIPFNVSGMQYNPNVNNSLLDLNLFPGNQSAANVTAPPQAFPFNASTDSFLTELLQNDELDINFDAMDLNGTEAAEQDEEKMDDASSDSAVSSMAGSSSPDDMYDRLSSFSGSNYHGVEGATGGHDDVFSPSVNLKKEVQDSHFSYEDFGFSEEPMASTSTNSSDTDFKVPLPEHNTVAEPRHVAHNHTYPLAPGQQPRERKLTAEERRATAQMTRDEKKCRAAKIPFTIDDIIHSPVDEFNDLLTKYKLSDAQLQLIRDVRRRGKNKVAAQNCRKRKMEVIQSLEDEVNAIRQEKERLTRERNRLHKGRTEMKDKYNQMYQEVFRSLRDDNGRPYDPSQFTLQHTSDGNVFLVPVNATSPPTDHDEKPLHKRKNKKNSR